MFESPTSLYYLGIALTAVVNLSIIASRYIVKEFHISPFDTILFKGIVQIPVYLLVILRRRQKCRNRPDIANAESTKEVDYAFIPPTLREKIGIFIWGSLGGLPFACQFVSVQKIPMADFTALNSLAPILAYIAARFLLKHKFTFLKVTCCLVLIIGVTMVVQPPIIFGEASQGGTNFDTDYMIGLAFAAVFLASVTILVNAPLVYPDVPNDVVMFWMGVGTIVTPFVCAPWMGIPMKFYNDFASITLEYGLISFGLGVAGVIQNSAFVPLIRMSGPTAVAMVMRTEILLVLVADCAIFAIYPDTIASVGYAIVLACSFGLILAPKIEDKLCPTNASMPKEISGSPRENEAYVKEA